MKDKIQEAALMKQEALNILAKLELFLDENGFTCRRDVTNIVNILCETEFKISGERE